VRLEGGHLPGEQRPQPSAKGRTFPAERVNSGQPSPQFPAPISGARASSVQSDAPSVSVALSSSSVCLVSASHVAGPENPTPRGPAASV